jgi:hypothetical protein
MKLNRRMVLCAGASVAALVSMDPAAALLAAPLPSFKDPLYTQPYIDVDEWRDEPVRHRHVHGGFEGTDLKFIMQFPPKERYQGRFFQHFTAVVTSEMSAGAIWNNDFIGFAADSGGAAVVSNQGGLQMALRDDLGGDQTIGGYRASAAVAMYARKLAQEMYGPHRTYGYGFGGSGGGYRSFSAAEMTHAWDGVVPYIHGNLFAWPNGNSVRARAQRVLGAKMPLIADALEPGGSDDPLPHLTPLEREVYTEASKSGFPMKTLVFHEAMGPGAITVIFQNIQRLDPGYFTDFWTKPGYLGHDNPEVFDGARVQHRTRVKRVIMSDQAAAAGLPAPGGPGRRGQQADPNTAYRAFEADYGGPLPVAFELETVPPADSFLTLANIRIVDGEAAGKQLDLAGLVGNLARIQFSPNSGAMRDVTEAIRPGDEVVIDNSNFLAFETMYRHTLLPPDYYVGNFLRRADGTPIYPQRPTSIHHPLMAGAIPTVPTGRFFGKMIVVNTLLDWDAHPWSADWYRTKVREHLGEDFDDRYRLYYIAHGTHGSIPDVTRTVPYTGALQQALRDLAAWVENDVPPPPETQYRVVDGQVVVPERAPERKGIQPTAVLLANGKERAEVRVGELVTFTALLETPPGAGEVVDAEWDFQATATPSPGEGGRFPLDESFTPAPQLNLTREHRFDQPGTYYPAVRIHSLRRGDKQTPYARIANLGRVRVIVT